MCKNKLFYESNHKIKEVKKNNWHHILNDIGWEKLHKQWIKKLNSYLKKTTNNSLYGSLDCGSDGDCLFHCISYALKSKELYNINYECDVQTLRKLLSDSIDSFRKNCLKGIKANKKRISLNLKNSLMLLS